MFGLKSRDCSCARHLTSVSLRRRRRCNPNLEGLEEKLVLSSFYVAPNGSDLASGSAQHPWATVRKAANSVKAGDTVLLADGTYTSGGITISRSGTPTAHIVFRSINKWGAKVVVPNSGLGSGDAIALAGGYIDIQDIDLSGALCSSGIGIEPGSPGYVTVTGCRIHDIDPTHVGSGGGGICEHIRTCVGNVYSGNQIFKIGNPNNHSVALWHGVYTAGAGATIENNVCYLNNGAGIHVYHGGSHQIIANNLCFSNGSWGILSGGGESSKAISDYNTVVNNLIMNNHRDGIADSSAYVGAHMVYQNNLFYGNGGSDYSLFQGRNVSSTIPGGRNQNPQLVNYKADGTGDYHLTAGSPCIGAGVSLGAPPTDHDGKHRPSVMRNGYDIGPYQHSGMAPSGVIVNSPVSDR